MSVGELLVANPNSIMYCSAGVIALRASAYMGAARGTLSFESDSLASSGTAVIEEQTIIGSSFLMEFSDETQRNDDWNEAEDTLVVDLSTINFNRTLPYEIWISYRFTGEDDHTLHYLDNFRYIQPQAVQIMIDGLGITAAALNSPWTTFGDTVGELHTRRFPYYSLFNVPSDAQVGYGLPLDNTYISDFDATIRFRAFQYGSPSGTIRIDSIFFVPLSSYLALWSNYGITDARAEPGGLDSVSLTGVLGGTGNQFVDFQGSEIRGGQEYQKATNEADSSPSAIEPFIEFVDEFEPSLFILHATCGPHYLPLETVVNDTFTRTRENSINDISNYAGSNYYVYDEESDTGFFSTTTNGTQAVFFEDGGVEDSWIALGAAPTFDISRSLDYMRSHVTETTIDVNSDPTVQDFYKFGITGNTSVFGGGSWPLHRVECAIVLSWMGGGQLDAKLIMNATSDGTTYLAGPPQEDEFIIDGPVNILLDWVPGSEKINLKFKNNWYAVYAKIWRDGETEPTNWDLFGHMPGYQFINNSDPYDVIWESHPWALSGGYDSLYKGSFWNLYYPYAKAIQSSAYTFKLYMDYFKVNFDPGGDEPASQYIRVENSIGNEVITNLEVPYGSQYLVSLGAYPWFGSQEPKIYTWSVDTAPDLQSAVMTPYNEPNHFLRFYEVGGNILLTMRYRAYNQGEEE